MPDALAAADAALRADPVLGGLVAAHGPCRLGRRPAPTARFAALANSVVAQQLGGAAAAAIQGRVEQALGGAITPQALLATGPDTLRAAGLSRAKTATLLDLAAHVADGRLDLARIGRQSDDAVEAALTAVRGIGPWTAHMFLIFALHRLDVWPTGDLGVRAGWAVAFGGELPAPRELHERGEPYRPYRSVVAWYCWRALEASRRPPR